MERENPSYYSFMPAEVRYDTDLVPNAKLLFSEITALSNKTGECGAGDSYFAELYGVHTNTIQAGLKQLEDKQYIIRIRIYKENSKEIDKRIIKITGTYQLNNWYPTPKKTDSPTPKKTEDNNINIINNINNNSIKETRHQHGTYKHILLTDDDFNKFKSEYPINYNIYIEEMDSWIEAKGNSPYKNYLAALRNWAKRDYNKHQTNKVDTIHFKNENTYTNREISLGTTEF